MRIAVIGAGPGGGAAALRLARAGLPVTFYALSKRGEKPCGGGLPDYLLPRLDGFDPSALPRAEPARVRIDAGLGFSVRRPVEGLSIFRRRDLDAALAAAAESAGARRVDEKVIEIGWSPPGDGARPTVRTARGAHNILKYCKLHTKQQYVVKHRLFKSNSHKFEKTQCFIII